MNYVIFEKIKDIIKEYQNKVKLKLCSKEYAKGYCYGIINGIMDTSKGINDCEYDELSKLIDETFE